MTRLRTVACAAGVAAIVATAPAVASKKHGAVDLRIAFDVHGSARDLTIAVRVTNRSGRAIVVDRLGPVVYESFDRSRSFFESAGSEGRGVASASPAYEFVMLDAEGKPFPVRSPNPEPTAEPDTVPGFVQGVVEPGASRDVGRLGSVHLEGHRVVRAYAELAWHFAGGRRHPHDRIVRSPIATMVVTEPQTGVAP